MATVKVYVMCKSLPAAAWRVCVSLLPEEGKKTKSCFHNNCAHIKLVYVYKEYVPL